MHSLLSLIFSNSFTLVGVVMDPKPILETLVRQHYILDGTPALTLCHAHTFIPGANSPSGMFLGGERKPEDQEKTHTDMQRK